jgi:hypothetical protein
VLLENIRLNSIETTIFPINAGLASRPGKILLEEVDIETTNVTYYRPKDQERHYPSSNSWRFNKRIQLKRCSFENEL